MGCLENYKRPLRIVSIFIIVSRISGICHEISYIKLYYPQTHSFVFCALSIILGAVSIGLELLVIRATVKKKITGIPPWFLCTFVIFLIAALAFAVTASLYIIRPLDHNLKVEDKIKHHKGVLKPFEEVIPPTTAPVEHQQNRSDYELLQGQIRKALHHFTRNGKDFSKTWSDNDATAGLNETVTLSATLNGTEIFSERVPVVFRHSKCSKKELVLQMEFYSVRPFLALSFLLDAVRAFPQMYLVNKYVKSERLHHSHYHSHASLATLYVKQ